MTLSLEEMERKDMLATKSAVAQLREENRILLKRLHEAQEEIRTLQAFRRFVQEMDDVEFERFINNLRENERADAAVSAARADVFALLAPPEPKP